MPDEIEALIRRTTRNPTVIEVTRRATPVSAVKQVVHPVAMTSKKDLLASLLDRAEMGPTLVFTRTKARANQLVRRLEKSSRQVAAIHGNKSQSARTRALAGFRDGRIDTLIATDIAARGIDVEGISHVINFDLPHVPEDYVHRIGRTARAGSSGHAVSLAAPEERLQLAAIERLVGAAIPRETVAGFGAVLDVAPPERQRQSPRPKRRTRTAGADEGRTHWQPPAPATSRRVILANQVGRGRGATRRGGLPRLRSRSRPPRRRAGRSVRRRRPRRSPGRGAG